MLRLQITDSRRNTRITRLEPIVTVIVFT